MEVSGAEGVEVWYASRVDSPWTDPFMIRALAIMAAVLCVVGAACYLLQGLSERLEARTPSYRRQLEAAYASFHRFLLAVRLAALRGTRT